MRFAQSRGECPGSNSTFLEGRLLVGSVDVDAGIERPFEVDLRLFLRDAAADGGGASDPLSFGRGRRADALTAGGGIKDVAGTRGGGCMVRDCFFADGEEEDDAAGDVFGEIDAAV